MAYKKSNANGQATMANSEPVVIASNQSAVPVSFTGSTDVATQTTLAAINSKLVTGTDIGDVTINNAAGAAAVNIQDGGNSITIDGSVTTSGTVTEANSAAALTALQLIDNAVSGAGYNITQMNGVNLLMGAGNTGTGSQRVTIASDQAAVASKAAINTYVDGSIVTIGAKADAKSTATDTTAVTLMQVTKQISASVQTIPSNVAHDSADSGNPLKVGGRASTTPVTAVAANDRVDAFFDVQGRQVVTAKALTGTTTSVNASATNVTVLAANTARLGATFMNLSTATLYLKLGATATATTSYTVKMPPDAYYEMPFGYYGIVDGIWSAANGYVNVTEIS